MRSYLFLGNKKCRIYAACGVSQTPRGTRFERGTKYWQKEWQVSIKKDVLPAEYVKILVRWQWLKFIVGAMR